MPADPSVACRLTSAERFDPFARLGRRSGTPAARAFSLPAPVELPYHYPCSLPTSVAAFRRSRASLLSEHPLRNIHPNNTMAKTAAPTKKASAPAVKKTTATKKAAAPKAAPAAVAAVAEAKPAKAAPAKKAAAKPATAKATAKKAAPAAAAPAAAAPAPAEAPKATAPAKKAAAKKPAAKKAAAPKVRSRFTIVMYASSVRVLGCHAAGC